MPSSAPPPDPEAAYFQAVEDYFVSRRGDPLILSNADWVLIDTWRRRGIPLRIVLRGIGDALDSHAHSWSRTRKVKSLRYCAAEVEAAHERWERALALGPSGDGDAAGTLRGFAEALDKTENAEPPLTEIISRTARELRERAASPHASIDLEPWLKDREDALVAAIRDAADSEEVARIEHQVAAVLEPYRSRMPRRVLAQIQADSVARRLLESRGLPRLSLFLA